MLKALSRLLMVEGFEIRPYASARQFLTEHDGNAPGCVILDLNLPELTGLDLQDAIGATTQPVIFISGGSDIPASVAAMKKGALDFLTKPFSNDTLLNVIKDAVQKDQHARRHNDQVRVLRERLKITDTSRERSLGPGLIRQVKQGNRFRSANCRENRQDPPFSCDEKNGCKVAGRARALRRGCEESRAGNFVIS
jgi:FixJ family two-component response regulator